MRKNVWIIIVFIFCLVLSFSIFKNVEKDNANSELNGKISKLSFNNQILKDKLQIALNNNDESQSTAAMTNCTKKVLKGMLTFSKDTRVDNFKAIEYLVSSNVYSQFKPISIDGTMPDISSDLKTIDIYPATQQGMVMNVYVQVTVYSSVGTSEPKPAKRLYQIHYNVRQNKIVMLKYVTDVEWQDN
ncbi:hypothetical protein EQG49_13490 [Periweissella cryptocerci]|uniref:Uncharacterized protein n=1 Tax=Periweissella cryptocerci TaxID=2506420 RepID=A0A4P6YX57_9LACO|nr:hypothetical protein [Periweissella cryptocerci]QBO37411.1 hypothetical protein EQG49_13490 [Periweissella cryptocerci]